MKKQFTAPDPAMKNGYIPAPYVLEEGEKITDFYLESVLFHNENGPTTGKMSLTMVSCPEVIAISEKEIDGVMREVCASPNDVPGYDKDQYIDPAILAKVKGGSYAYCDEDGNYYRSGFGLRY